MDVNIQNVPLQPIGESGGHALMSPHIGSTDYLLPPKTDHNVVNNFHECRTNENFWRDISYSNILPGDQVSLSNFQIVDWFPRAPGLYHTDLAELARNEAYNYLHSGPGESPIREHAQRARTTRPTQDYTVIFTPEGKLSMLQGGIGCIRLKPISIGGDYHWLITATSDGVAHRGVPMAVPVDHYRSLIPIIQDRGSVCANVYGIVEYVPTLFSRLFDQSIQVPKLYIRVTDIEFCDSPPLHPEVSVAVSFLSRYREWRDPEVFATFVTFHPNIDGSFEDAIHWMKTEYVEGEYNGTIITDFDQTQTIFREASLALSMVMDRLVARETLQETLELMHASGDVERYYDELDRQALLPSTTSSERTHIFISYAHAVESETGWVDRTRIHLEGLSNTAAFEWWDDTKIRPGKKWHQEIQAAIDRSRVAILFITPEFLASKYITEVEIPLLLEKADAEGAVILCVSGSAVHLSGVAQRLSKYQFVNNPDQPLQSLSEGGRETIYTKIVQAVEEAFVN